MSSNYPNPHSLNLACSIEIKDGMGKTKRVVNIDSKDLIKPFYFLGRKKFPGKSFTQEFGKALYAVMQGSGYTLPGGAFGGDISKIYIQNSDGGGITINGCGSGGEGSMPPYFDGTSYDVVKANDSYTDSKFGISPKNLLMPTTTANFNGTKLIEYAPVRSGRNIIVSAIIDNRTGTYARQLSDIFLVATHKPSTVSFMLYTRDKRANSGNFVEMVENIPIGESRKISDVFSFPSSFVSNYFNVSIHDNFVKYICNALFLSSGFETFIATNGSTTVTQSSTTYGGTNLLIDVLTDLEYDSQMNKMNLSNNYQGGDLTLNNNVILPGTQFGSTSTKTFSFDTNELISTVTLSQDFYNPISKSTRKISAFRLLLDSGQVDGNSKKIYSRLIASEFSSLRNDFINIGIDDTFTVNFKFQLPCGALNPKGLASDQSL